LEHDSTFSPMNSIHSSSHSTPVICNQQSYRISLLLLLLASRTGTNRVLSWRRPQKIGLLLPRAEHLAVLTTMLRGIVGLDDASLGFVGLREGVPTLLAHAHGLADPRYFLRELDLAGEGGWTLAWQEIRGGCSGEGNKTYFDSLASCFS
jgi:hypothetical protein